MMNEIKAIAVQLQQLQQQAYIVYEPLVANLIAQQVKDNSQIEHLLDGILDFCGDSQMLQLYKKLCRYYWDINPQATADYINFYKEMWDSE